MKKLFLILTILTTIVMTAQDVKGKNNKKSFIKDLSSEQIASLKTKKMTLKYNLSDKQVDAIYKIHLDLVNKHRSKTKISTAERKKLSSEEKYNLMSKKLDDKIETKKRFAAILSEKQMDKFEMHTKRKRKTVKKRMYKNRNRL